MCSWHFLAICLSSHVSQQKQRTKFLPQHTEYSADGVDGVTSFLFDIRFDAFHVCLLRPPFFVNLNRTSPFFFYTRRRLPPDRNTGAFWCPGNQWTEVLRLGLYLRTSTTPTAPSLSRSTKAKHRNIDCRQKQVNELVLRIGAMESTWDRHPDHSLLQLHPNNVTRQESNKHRNHPSQSVRLVLDGRL